MTKNKYLEPTPLAVTPKAKDVDTGLSTHDTAEAALETSKKAQAIDAAKLDKLEAIRDNNPPGHVSIRPKDKARLKEWADNPEHPFTKEVDRAITHEVRKKKSE